MADFYVSSTTWAAVSQWAATTAYIVGDLRRPLTAPSFGREHVFRCTTAGTSGGSEPTWSTATGNNATRTDGTVTWTNVSGQSTYGWTAAAGTLSAIVGGSPRPSAGDRVFVASDHSDSAPSGTQTFTQLAAAFGVVQHISVNRAGSVPPVAADILAGAAITAPSTFNLDGLTNTYWQGFTFTGAGTTFSFSSTGGNKSQYFKNCTFKITSASATARYTSSGGGKTIWDNCTAQFGNTGQGFAAGTGSFDFLWINTASAIAGATIPTTLFNNNAATVLSATCRGVDLSAITGTLLNSANAVVMSKILLDSCKIASGATRLNLVSTTGSPAHDEIELINCYDGTNIINERHTAGGAVTIDRSTYMNSGAQDDVGNFSLKLVSTARTDKCSFPLDCFWFDVENTATGSPKTATVEIISSGSLNDDDISLLLQYMGTASSSVASFTSSLPTVLTTGSALTSSSVTWTGSPGTPQKQKVQVTFTPQTAGRVRGLVKLGKVSATVWLNPQIAIT